MAPVRHRGMRSVRGTVEKNPECILWAELVGAGLPDARFSHSRAHAWHKFVGFYSEPKKEELPQKKQQRIKV